MVRVTAISDLTERKRAEDELRRRAEQLEAIHETSLDITAPHGLPTVLTKIVERATHLLACTSGGLYLCDPARDEVRCVVSYNTLHNYVGVILRYGEGAAGIVAETGKPLNIPDYREWAGRAAVFDADSPFGAVLNVPMISQGRVLGVLTVNSSERQFTHNDQTVLSLFADHAAIAVENARLLDEVRRLAYTDELTGISNRRQLFQLGAREFSRAQRYGHALAALMAENEQQTAAALHDAQQEYDSAVRLLIAVIGGGIAGDFPICVVPMLRQDLARHDTPLWGYFCQISDSTTSYGSYSGAIPNEKITWEKLSIHTPKYVIESDASIVAPLIFAYVLGC